jgi:hypothetical protein
LKLRCLLFGHVKKVLRGVVGTDGRVFDVYPRTCKRCGGKLY